MRVLFHVQHLLGLGHLRRSELIATALAERGIEVIVALGGHAVAEVPFERAEVVELPTASIRGTDFRTLFDASGMPVDEAWRERRRDALLDLFRRVRPDLVLLELYPFGRWRFGFELEPLLALAASHEPRIKCATSVRDVLVQSTKRDERRDGKIRDIADRFLDRILVHADPTLFRFEETYPGASELNAAIEYTGYVAEPAELDKGRPTGDVVVSAGGGAAAGKLLETALAAKPLSSLNDCIWRIYTGPLFPDDAFAALAARADERTIVSRFASDFQKRIDGCALSISQAGYNTVMNLLRANVPAVVVPYDEAQETEQAFRAQRLEERGLIRVLASAELDAVRMARTMEDALAMQARREVSIDLDGANRTAKIIEEMIGR